MKITDHVFVRHVLSRDVTTIGIAFPVSQLFLFTFTAICMLAVRNPPYVRYINFVDHVLTGLMSVKDQMLGAQQVSILLQFYLFILLLNSIGPKQHQTTAKCVGGLGWAALFANGVQLWALDSVAWWVGPLLLVHTWLNSISFYIYLSSFLGYTR